jgi:hypothetical protein
LKIDLLATKKTCGLFTLPYCEKERFVECNKVDAPALAANEGSEL